MIYKLYKTSLNEEMVMVKNIDGSALCIPFDHANTEYANFKANILADKATLQDANGNEMSAELAKEFVSTLP